MSYAIWKASYCGSFDEVALALQSAFRQLGIDAPISRTPDFADRTTLVLGSCMLPKRSEPLPAKMIIYNMEQVTPGTGWFHPSYGYVDFLKRHPVWDYSPVNIRRLREMGIADPILCGVGYAPELTRIPPAPVQDIDVAFAGSLCPRRTKILDGLRAANLRVDDAAAYGEARDARFARSKIVLNMHKETPEIFEIVRVSYLLANRLFVVSETGTDTALEDPLRAGVAFAPYDKLVETCAHYAKAAQSRERRRIADEGFARFSARPQAEMLKAALEKTARPQNETVAAPAPPPRIFVALAAQDGAECRRTVETLFAQAAHPERVSVGIGCQDGDASAAFEPYKPRVRLAFPPAGKPYDDREALASAIVLLRQGEDYLLQLVNGAEMEKDWDETLIATLTRCEANALKPVLTAFLPRSRPAPDAPMRLRAAALDMHHAAVSLEGKPTRRKDKPAIYPSPFVCPHLIFARAEMTQHVPTDPYLPAANTALVYGARLWTHGYTLFQPETDVARFDGPPIPTRTDDERGRRRARHLLGLELAEESDDALMQIGRFGHGTLRDLESFWRFADIDSEQGKLRPGARDGAWNLRVLAEQPAIPKLPRIFVQIPAYRDPECQHTVRDLFAKAAHPDRIFVGICWQFVPGEDRHCFQTPYPFPDQVRVIEKDAREGLGACWARAIVQTLWEGEEYTLQIDSHMRFEPGWDETLIAMLAQAEQKSHGSRSKGAVLTTYPAGYTPPDDIPHRIAYSLVAKEFDGSGIFTMNSHHIPQNPAPAAPLLGAFASACMLFGRSDIISDVPYDPYIYFFGEEITLGVRLWTHGYDIYHPQLPVVYHYWKRSDRRTHFDDHRQWPLINKRSFARVRHLLGTENASDPTVLHELNRYGLGSARTLQEYQAFSGVDFAQRMISPAAYAGSFPADKANTATQNSNQLLGPTAGPIMPPTHFVIGQPRGGQPRKTLETPDCMVFDDFLPEDEYQQLYHFATDCDYEHINTHGKVKRVWDIGNGFPLRGEHNIFYYHSNPPQPKPEWVYPSSVGPLDRFIEHTNRIAPLAAHLIGKPGEWEHFSATAWLYPPGTGLSMHDDGSGVYTGAYVYFMSPVWRPHWGGLLLVVDRQANDAIREYKKQGDPYTIHRRKWLHTTEHADLIMDHGYAQCVLPKRNRMVFLHPEAYHMVTQVLPAAGDNIRMSLAGFFNRGKRDKQAQTQY